ncbi:MAG TPA: FAD-dependent hydroxylase [Oscillatoriales cyanobacterium M59_W2019_021]|nr:MAG: FAD-dependent hydroxylase [Cyanobacteria bacterium J055]HIK31266.1 FAD-dependent hydroxylase [Oscillatoriales cyanobacterium M4454_W2019_049]HIK51886.1 FAD-dependent hydroxylase [Oscillatoriales cyanobacterium M59_W2019_021]
MPTEQLEKSTAQPAPNPSQLDCDIAIVGGGVAGTTLACALKNSGLSVILIDALSPTQAAARQQVYAITLLSGRIWDGIGVWDEIFSKITPFRQISLTDSGEAEVRFQQAELGLDRLGYVAEHTPLLTTLQAFLQDAENVTCLSPVEVVGVEYQADGVTISLERDGKPQTLRSRLVVAADGTKSRLREAAGIRTRGWKYWQSCITVKVKPERSHENIAYERFWPSGPFAILPLTGDRCNIVWTAPHDEAKALAELDDEAFLAELSRRYGSQMGNLEVISPRFVFQVQLMQSDRYVLPRLALLGDAAHCCHPVGGQGLNMGIRDAAMLAQVLQAAHQQGEDLGDLRVLKRYERIRRWENWAILGFTDFLDRTFSNHWLPLVAARRLGLWTLRHIAPVKLVALRLMTGLLGYTPQLARDKH